MEWVVWIKVLLEPLIPITELNIAKDVRGSFIKADKNSLLKLPLGNAINILIKNKIESETNAAPSGLLIKNATIVSNGRRMIRIALGIIILLRTAKLK